ncbi:hypothetical protein HYALB_00010928 [Hymenoscyphus albidus]|uniref:Uncharacterized protein n=1 Tax=Hymenoscyphus albidus TaxID=595503 RepID=A0A9N9LJI6_9HELO|nr:hypothetical protein HYALB_00010928 [Hymenoscyphus albidus]
MDEVILVKFENSKLNLAESTPYSSSSLFCLRKKNHSFCRSSRNKKGRVFVLPALENLISQEPNVVAFVGTASTTKI